MGNPQEIPVLKPNMELAQPGEQQPEADEAGRKLYDAVRPSVVQIVTDKGKGSGFILDDRGRIMTDAHVIDGSREIIVIAQDGKRYKAGIENIDDTGDLATLKLLNGKSPGPAVTFGDTSKLKQEDLLYGVGHAQGLRPAYLSPGYYRFKTSPLNIFANGAPDQLDQLGAMISTWTPSEQKDITEFLKRPVVQALLHQKQGNSGGPVFNSKGEVIGVTQMVSDNDMAYMAPSEHAQAFLRSDPKFKIGHGLQSSQWTESYKGLWHNEPALAGLTTAAAGGIGYGGYRLAMRVPRIAGVALAVDGVTSALDDIPKYFNSTDSRDSWRYGLASGGDLLQTAGAIAMFFPKARTVGAIAATLGIGTRIGSDFVPSRYMVTDITRTDGTPRPPFSMLRQPHTQHFDIEEQMKRLK